MALSTAAHQRRDPLFSLLDDALHRLRGSNCGLPALILPRDDTA
jgi:hypothetical protein